jgi:UDP-N-acetylmuramate dehydrogenase
VGGAIAGNAHWAGHLISEHVVSVTLLTRGGLVTELAAERMDFAYDRSRVQQTGELVLSATFRLAPGQAPDQLRATARASLLHRKQTQPLRLPSAGCVFQNPAPGIDTVPDGIPWSAGALIDRAGLKGTAIGVARVSPVHANFIVNEGGATASDVRALIELCRAEVERQFGVHLRDEIVCVGEF